MVSYLIPYLQYIIAWFKKIFTYLRQRFIKSPIPYYHNHAITHITPHSFQQKKPAWVTKEILLLHERFDLSHRKLSDLFNQRYFALTGISVGRTWVRQLIKKQAYTALHLQRTLKHRIPPPLPNNKIWATDTTCLMDSFHTPRHLIGIIDHGTRFNLILKHLPQFNAWSFLGHLFLAISKFGKPCALRMDNHPVFHSKLVKKTLRFFSIQQQFTQPASPWQNGFIERFFGTLKQKLLYYKIYDTSHLTLGMPHFQFWYNVTRPHQHLFGLTPYQAWHHINPYTHIPKSVQYFSAWNNQLRGMVLRH